MDKLDMFQAIFVKVDGFVSWYMEIIQTEADTKFTSKEFQEGLSIHVVLLSLEAPYH